MVVVEAQAEQQGQAQQEQEERAHAAPERSGSHSASSLVEQDAFHAITQPEAPQPPPIDPAAHEQPTSTEYQQHEPPARYIPPSSQFSRQFNHNSHNDSENNENETSINNGSSNPADNDLFSQEADNEQLVQALMLFPPGPTDRVIGAYVSDRLNAHVAADGTYLGDVGQSSPHKRGKHSVYLSSDLRTRFHHRAKFSDEDLQARDKPDLELHTNPLARRRAAVPGRREPVNLMQSLLNVITTASQVTTQLQAILDGKPTKKEDKPQRMPKAKRALLRRFLDEGLSSCFVSHKNRKKEKEYARIATKWFVLCLFLLDCLFMACRASLTIDLVSHVLLGRLTCRTFQKEQS